MNILSSKSLSCYAILLPNLGDTNCSRSKITLCCIEGKPLSSCFLCKIIQVIRHPSSVFILQVCWHLTRALSSRESVSPHCPHLACVHNAPGILVDKAGIEVLYLANHKLVLGLQVIQKYPFNILARIAVTVPSQYFSRRICEAQIWWSHLCRPHKYPILSLSLKKNPTLVCRASVGLLYSLPFISAQSWREVLGS